MPASIKVLAPERLPEGELTEQAFQTYQTELEVYLYLNEKFRPFLKGGAYQELKTKMYRDYQRIKHRQLLSDSDNL